MSEPIDGVSRSGIPYRRGGGSALMGGLTVAWDVLPDCPECGKPTGEKCFMAIGGRECNRVTPHPARLPELDVVGDALEADESDGAPPLAALGRRGCDPSTIGRLLPDDPRPVLAQARGGREGAMVGRDARPGVPRVRPGREVGCGIRGRWPMSTCISKHGEFGSHELDADYVCTRCSVLDEDGLIAELHQARSLAQTRLDIINAQRDPDLAANYAQVRKERDDLRATTAELERQRDAVLELCRRTSRRDLTGYHESPCWPLDPGSVIDLLGGRPVLLDVSRDPQRHPRDEDGRYPPEGERCREMATRRCPDGPCGSGPCARFKDVGGAAA